MNPYGADRYLGSERIHSRQINEVVEGLICVFVEEILGFFVIGGIVDGISSRSVEVKMPSVPSFAMIPPVRTDPVWGRAQSSPHTLTISTLFHSQVSLKT
jgi:hypothetical protein